MANQIEIQINPVSKPRMTRSDRWKERPEVVKYWKFCDKVREVCNKAGFELGNSYSVLFAMQMPKSWSEKKKQKMCGSHHLSKPDLDNLLKSLNDCLMSGGDSTIFHIDAKKIWDYEGSINIINIESRTDDHIEAQKKII